MYEFPLSAAFFARKMSCWGGDVMIVACAVNCVESRITRSGPAGSDSPPAAGGCLPPPPESIFGKMKLRDAGCP